MILLAIIQIVSLNNAFALNDSNVRNFLNDREKVWPKLYLPEFKLSDTSKDLVYPSWFEGNWLVTSEDLTQESKETIVYTVNFYKNNLNEVVGNRSKNSESIGKAIFGDDLIKVTNDPKSVNNQIIYLKNDQYIESRIKARNQINDNELFFADEFVIQTVHKPGASRINQVEIISKFQKCEEKNEDIINFKKTNICGLQYISTYGSRVGDSSVKAINTNKYKLTFEFIGL